jgi:ribosomal protein S18 acetylase RimI-like enzyme
MSMHDAGAAPPAAGKTGAADAEAVIEVLTDAFCDEPLLDHWLRQGAAKQRARRDFFDYGVRGGIHPRAQAWLSPERDAAAIWLPPGAHAFDLPPLRQIAVMPRLYRIAGLSGIGRALRLGEHLTRLHPPEPHAHLAFLGVRTHRQGQGLGSALLKTTLADVDRDGLAAYLETATEANVRLYQRHGFVITHEGRAPDDGPRFWTMLRAASR